MKKTFKKATSLFLIFAMVLTMSTGITKTAFAAEKPPTSVSYAISANSSAGAVGLDFGSENASWINAITKVTVNEKKYNNGNDSFFPASPYFKSSTRLSGAYGSYAGVDLSEVDTKDGAATVVISATGYEDLTVKITKSNQQYIPEIVTSDNDVDSDKEEPKTISLDKIKISDNGGILAATSWYFTFDEAKDFVANITEVTVNDETWEGKSFSPSAGGAYFADKDNNRLVFSIKNYGSKETLKSGDIINIKADGYNNLTFKFVLDKNGENPYVTDGDEKGDVYQLHAKIEGSFEATITGQKNYDGVSGATGSTSSNKNSNVTVYGALTDKDVSPTDKDWEELGSTSSNIKLEGSKCSVSIVPNTEAGTSSSADSGMTGVFSTISSALTLNGTPKDPGSYLISIKITDDQGRTATSNTLDFKIYSGEEKLADQLVTSNFKETQDGKYLWDIMEPWAIKNFGSNVKGQDNSVRVPADLKAWYGSHESGTYGYLGYDIPWTDVKSGNIPQTLYIPSGCNLTFVNMEILSSVHIVVENGGTLNLRDSVVQGIIDVDNGGTFSMNYDSYSNEFLTGSSICGQLRLADGAILENASIYSNTNYLANGDLADRTNSDAVVAATGNVTVNGKVFIKGDEAGADNIGQTGLKVTNGTVNITSGSTLVTYGGNGKVQLFAKSGNALQLENATITGDGKLVAIAGQAMWGNGGMAVSGSGTISAYEAFLQGATGSKLQNATPGKAVFGDINVTSKKIYKGDGTLGETGADDPLATLYWTAGVDKTPNLDLFETADAPVVPETPETPNTPDAPTVPEDPETPENPGTSEVPNNENINNINTSTNKDNNTDATSSSTKKDTKSSSKDSVSSEVQTGDQVNVALISLICLISLAGVSLVTLKKEKHNN